MRDQASDLPIEFEAVSYSAGQTAILHDVSLTLGPGPPTALIGPNGSGKTTLLKLAMGLNQPVAGRIARGGRTNGAPLRRAFVFQKPTMLRRSTAANVAFALKAAGRPADRATIDMLLDQVGLARCAGRPARRLSGGEQQRLALARALARNPEVLFLDEPTASLDPAGTKAVEEIIAQDRCVRREGGHARRTISARRDGSLPTSSFSSAAASPSTPPCKVSSPPRDLAGCRFVRGDLVV